MVTSKKPARKSKALPPSAAEPLPPQRAAAPHEPMALDMLHLIGRGVVPPVLNDPERRVEMGLPADENERGRYMIELNILYRGGLRVITPHRAMAWFAFPADCTRFTFPG